MKLKNLTKFFLGSFLTISPFLPLKDLPQNSIKEFSSFNSQKEIINKVEGGGIEKMVSSCQDKENKKEIVKNILPKVEPKYSAKQNTLFSYRYLDFLRNDDLLYKNALISMKKEDIEVSLNNFEEYFKDSINTDSLSKLTPSQIEKIFLYMDSSIPLKISPQGGQECFKRALIYYAIAEKNNYPVSFVLAPPIHNNYHIFVRWDLNRDGHDVLNPENPINKGDFLWDNNSKRAKDLKIDYGKTDDFFIDDYDISRKSLENKVYMKSLTEQEMFAFAYAYKASAYSDLAFMTRDETERKSIFKKALSLSDKALDLDSLCLFAYKAKAEILSNMRSPYKKYDLALKLINKALELAPGEEDLVFAKSEIYNHKGSQINYDKNLYGNNVEDEKILFNEFLGKSIDLYKEAIGIVDKRIKKEYSRSFPSYRKICELEKSKDYLSLHLRYDYIGEHEKAKEYEKKYEESLKRMYALEDSANVQFLRRMKEIKNSN